MTEAEELAQLEEEIRLDEEIAQMEAQLKMQAGSLDTTPALSRRDQYMKELQDKWKALEGPAKTDMRAVAERSQVRAEIQRMQDPTYIPGDRMIDDPSIPMAVLGGTAKLLDLGRGGIVAPGFALALEAMTGKKVFRGEELGDAWNPSNLNQYPSMSELYERAGVPQGATVSDYLPVEKGGFWDMTVRGGGGFASDMAIDPLNYLSFGAAGAGKTALKETAQEIAKRSALSWSKNPISKTVHAVGDGIGQISRKTGAQGLSEYLARSLPGRAVNAAAQAPSRLFGKGAETVYGSTLHGVESLAEKFNKEDVVGAMYRAGVKTPSAIRSEAKGATDLYMAQRDKMAQQAADAGATFDINEAFAPARAEVAKLRAEDTAAAHAMADRIEERIAMDMELNQPEVIYPARPEIPGRTIPAREAVYEVERPAIPDLPGSPDPIEYGMGVLPKGRGTEFSGSVEISKEGLPKGKPFYDKTSVEPEYLAEYSGTGGYVPTKKMTDLRQTVLEIPKGEELPMIPGTPAKMREVLPYIPEQVIPAIPARPAVLGDAPVRTPQYGFDLTSGFYDDTTSSAYNDFVKTTKGSTVPKLLARGTREQTLESIKKAMGPKFSKNVENLNRDTSAILATRPAQQTAQNQGNRLKDSFTTPTGTDKAIAALATVADGGAAAVTKALAVGKGIDFARYMTMPAGYYGKKASENQIIAPLLDMAGREAYRSGLGRGSRKERTDREDNPWSGRGK